MRRQKDAETLVTSIRLTFSADAESDELIHSRLMCPQQAAMRVAYNAFNDTCPRRKCQGEHNETMDVYYKLRSLFPLLTGRNINDAIELAQAGIASQLESDRSYLDYLQKKISRCEERGDSTERFRKKLADFHAERGERQVRPALFGGRALWKKVQRRVPGAREAWRDARTNLFYSKGDSTSNHGNHHAVITWNGEQPILSLRVPMEIVRRGERLSTRAMWLSFAVNVNRKQIPLLMNATQGDGKYSVRVIRETACRYTAFVSIEEAVAGHTLGAKESITQPGLIAGFDLNLDRLSVAIIERGQLIMVQDFTYPNLGELRTNKARPLLGALAAQVIAWLKEQNISNIVIEDLSNIQQRDGSIGYNRHTYKFAYRKLAESLVRRALREGLDVKKVNPAYTSWIGMQKYAKNYKLSRHQAAAWVIARRGAGYLERLPDAWVEVLQDIVVALQQVENQGEAVQTWQKRIEHWKDYSPMEQAHPWVLWVTLYLAVKNVSEVRAVVTNGRNCSRVLPRSVDNVQLRPRMGIRPIPSFT